MRRQNDSFTFYSIMFYQYHYVARAMMKALGNEAPVNFEQNLAPYWTGPRNPEPHLEVIKLCSCSTEHGIFPAHKC